MPTTPSTTNYSYPQPALGNASNFDIPRIAQALEDIDSDMSERALASRLVSPGTGLVGGGSLAADRTLSLSAATIASLGLADTAVQPARLISAGTGLTGGGSLALDRTLSLSAATIASLGKADTAVQPARSVSAGIGLSGGGDLSADRTLSLAASVQTSLSLADSAVQPARAITAGTGLTGGGSLAADRTISLSAASITSLGLADTAVQGTRTITAGTGLTGGGDLTLNRTISLSSASQASLALADTAVQPAELTPLAPLASPVFTGNPVAPTPAAGDNDTSIATTAFVQSAINQGGPLAGLRNKIINGAVDVWQRGTSFTVGSYKFTADRWQTVNDVDVIRSTDVPSGEGFTYSLRATARDTNNFRYMRYRVEARDAAPLAGGPATLSVWVKVNQACLDSGAFISLAYANAYDDFTTTTNITADGFSAEVRLAADLGVVANTWTRISVQYSSLPANAANGLGILLPLQHLAGASSGQAYYTGLQLEPGLITTPFERRPYGLEELLCKRYCEVFGGSSNHSVAVGYRGASNPYVTASTTVPMRAAPTVTFTASSPVIVGAGESALVTGLSASEVRGNKVLFVVTPNLTTAANQTTLHFQCGFGSYIYLSAEI